MTRAFQLSYVELATNKFDEELQYYEDVIGATVTERDSDHAYLSLGLDHHNIALVRSDESRFCALGLKVGQESPVETVSRFRARGLTAEVKSDARPGVPTLIEVKATEGSILHLFPEMTAPAPGFRNSGVAPNKLGHVALKTTRSRELVSLFVDGLGFRPTDWFEDVATFLTCNHDHHVLNVISSPVSKFHHMAFELRGWTHHYDASDLLGSAKIPIVWGPARHTAGHNLASYHLDPSGFLVEFYADMDILIPDLNIFEPRPWHGTLPQRPQVWPLDMLTTWQTKFEFDLASA